ncbi:hypothetical protein H0E84_17815 [Luteimonas sp. SJ-92]|uniref:Uncharacterized protein n=1 Tax=Luteimonas salinisoli TaxID=2752307 RepID=A0A853JH81_9GAMM|nr:hypothetical protein [Luteimonas salinisoli]NZA28235.1 hypothetical protein [Luteimonas salinisoli]
MASQQQGTPLPGGSGPADAPDLNNPGRNPDDPSRQPPDHPGRDDRRGGERGQEPPGQGHPRD